MSGELERGRELMNDLRWPGLDPVPGLKPAEIYAEQREHHGRVHNSMYAMPPQFAVVMGALWFFAANQLAKEPAISAMIFLFSAVIGWAMANAFASMARRAEQLREHLQALEGRYAFGKTDKPLEPRNWREWVGAAASMWRPGKARWGMKQAMWAAVILGVLLSGYSARRWYLTPVTSAKTASAGSSK